MRRRSLTRRVLDWPAWLRFPLLAACSIGLIAGTRMLWVLVQGDARARAERDDAPLVLGKAMLAAAGGGLAYALLRRPLARWGRIGSMLAGAVALFAFLAGCALAFRVRHIDGIAIGFGIGLSLVGGAIFDPKTGEEEFARERYAALRWFCHELLDIDATPGATLEARVRDLREHGEAGYLAALRTAVDDLRRDEPRVRIQMARELATWKAHTPGFDEFLERLLAALG